MKTVVERSVAAKPSFRTGSPWSLQLAEALHRMGMKAREDRVLSAATRCVLDYFAVSLAGLSEPVSNQIMNVVRTVGGGGIATALFGGERTSAPLAALANGTLAHALDFDDTLWSYVGHSTAVVFSAALAMAECADQSGVNLLTSFTLGVEAAHRIGSGVVSHMTVRGWHPTSAVGVFGSAAASTMIVDCSPQHTASALTVATNLASGLRQNFGTKVKPLASGWSAFSGVMASTLAQQGIAGSKEALEGPQGYYSAFAGTLPHDVKDDLEDELVLVSPGPGFKMYPCCTGTHPTIDAILGIQEERSLNPGAVVSIRVEVTPEVLGELIYPVPTDGKQARFSLPYCAAAAMVYREVGFEQFHDESLKDSRIATLMRRVKTEVNGKLSRIGGEHCPAARVTVMLHDGTKIQKTVSAAGGNPANPLSSEDLESKFFHCADRAGLPTRRAEQFLRQIKEIREISSIRRWVKSEVAPLFREATSFKEEGL